MLSLLSRTLARRSDAIERIAAPIAVKAIAALSLGIISTLPATAQWQKTYDASLGTLPQNQGWNYHNDDSGNPDPYIDNGLLLQNRILGSNNGIYRDQFFTTQDITNDFTSPDNKFIFEIRLKVNRSSYSENITGYSFGTVWRTGYSIYVLDNIGRSFVLGLSDNGIRLTSDANNLTLSNSTPFINFSTMADFTTYRLEVSNGIGNLFIDGDLQASLSSGTISDPFYFNEVRFGSNSVFTSATELQFVRYGNTSAAAPEPSAVALLGLVGVPFVAGVVRRRKA